MLRWVRVLPMSEKLRNGNKVGRGGKTLPVNLPEASKGAAQLETVSEPETGNQHTATRNDCEKLTPRVESNLRAINRKVRGPT